MTCALHVFMVFDLIKSLEGSQRIVIVVCCLQCQQLKSNIGSQLISCRSSAKGVTQVTNCKPPLSA